MFYEFLRRSIVEVLSGRRSLAGKREMLGAKTSTITEQRSTNSCTAVPVFNIRLAAAGRDP